MITTLTPLIILPNVLMHYTLCKMIFAFSLFLPLVGSSSAFIAPSTSLSRSCSNSLNVVYGDQEEVVDKIRRFVAEEAPPIDEQFDYNLKTIFPAAMSSNELEIKVVDALYQRGFTAANTLLGTSLCSDETAQRLADDFVKIYGNNFNLGGLAAFPFAGNIGFQTMAGHIPDEGYCLIVFGPHVGISRDGMVGKVEREGVSLVDDCCNSAIASLNYLVGASSGADPADFTDIQQGAVQNLMQPMGGQLQESEFPLRDLPYALYETQDNLIREIVLAGAGGTKRGIALLGGIQINTAPGLPDYFHPLRFDFMNSNGEIVEDMLPTLL